MWLNLTIVRPWIKTRWQDSISLSLILTPTLSKIFQKAFFQLIIRNWSRYTHNFHTFSSRILGICPALPLHVEEVIVSWLLTFLVIARSDLSCWKCSLSLHNFSANFVSEDSILCCILSIIAINSSLLSLLGDSSVNDALYLNNKNPRSYKIKLKQEYTKLHNNVKVKTGK